MRPDFLYRRADGDTAIFLDGPVHDGEHIKSKDDVARRRLENQGWLVLRFPTDRARWPALFADNPTVFGTRSSQ